MPEEPVCTCITAPLSGTRLRFIRVFDPYCQIDRHKKHATYAGPEPVYPKAGGNG